MNEKKEWLVVKIIERQVGKNILALRAKRLDLYHPRYSVEIGCIRAEGFRSFLDLAITVENAFVKLVSSVDAIRELVIEAESFICQEMQAHEDQCIERKMAIEARKIAPPANRGPVSHIPPRVGKTARDRGKTPGRRTNDPTLSQNARGK